MPLATPAFRPAPVRFALVIVACLCSLAAARQPAAPGQLPCTLAAKQTLDASDEQAIRTFVASHTPGLTDADSAINSKSRDALMAPLACSNITFAFRSKYGDLLTPVLAPIAVGKDERQAVNANLLLGRVRTTASAEALSAGLKSAGPVVRLAAASGYRDLVGQLAKDSFGFPEGALDRLFDSLATALSNEADPYAADIMTLAFGDATRGSATLRGRAVLRLTDAMERRLQSLRKSTTIDPMWSRTILRSLDLVRQAMLEQGGTGSIDKEFARRAGLLSGQVFAYGVEMLGRTTRSEDVDLSKAIAAAEGLAVIAHQAVTGQRLEEKGLQKAFDDSFSAGGNNEFRTAVQPWIGATGLLLKPPYNGPAASFAP